ncbi:hypothetical protein [Hymenobacter pini]|uniref:hypothetical protein n=1 Tax=Hymenobacter pini TaxID=2880879 RepID=UPI001CF39473|nr:hypothetical protein [Hymenobacter pini]MCA8830011.1 hypothetical protein [Hymenobacter pini]
MPNARYALALSALFAAASATAQVQPAPASPQPAPPPAAPAPPPAPATPAKSVPYGAGMKVNLSPDGSKYIRFLTWHQVYTRYTENNTGTLRAPGKPQKSQVDFGLRRSRLVLLAQLNPRFVIYTHLGINNQNAVSGGVAPTTDGKKPQFFIHEAVTEYKVNKYLSLGGGLHYVNGISRLTSASTTSIMPIDLPLTNFPTIEQTDQFARWLGIYAKGRIQKLDYRFSVSDPFLTNQTSTPLSLGTSSTVGGVTTNTGTGIAAYSPQNTSHVYQGYVSYNFLEPEANLLPYFQGTYLGTKRVFSVGAGFLYNKDAMYARPTSSVVTVTPAVAADPFGQIATNKYSMKMFGVDAFYDVPLDTAARTALTLYGVYYNYNMGPNHVRFIGPENPGYGTSPVRGNAVPQSGTGSSFYGQAGFLLPQRVLGPKARLQPYVAYLHSNYEGLHNSSGDTKGVNVYDAGVNVLLDGHNAKVTLNYRARPDFSGLNLTTGVVNSVNYKPEITLQTQIFL